MIHDILLSLLNPCSKNLPIEEFLLSDSVSKFLHPAEKEILINIIEIINIHRDIVKFILFFRSNFESQSPKSSLPSVLKESNDSSFDDGLQKSLYLQAFASGIDIILGTYISDIAELEKAFLKSPTHSLLFIYHKVNVFQPLLTHIQRLVRNIKSQPTLHSCAIIKYLNLNSLHGNKEILRAMKLLQSSVNVVFLKQLTHWILYAKIIDNYGEFFIQYSSNDSNKTNENCASVCGSGKIVNSTVDGISEAANDFEEIWHYEIIYDYLPHFISPTIAEKILFIGQTVLMFKVDANQRKIQQWNNFENRLVQEHSIWNQNENIFFQKIQALHNLNDLNTLNFELLIDEIKIHVTERLSQIAVDQADLIKQLKLIKDFYLLGRGELYLEFIKKLYEYNDNSKDSAYNCKENTIKDIVKAFEISASGVGITDELEQLTMTISKDATILDDSKNIETYMNLITLQYKINWPLQLLFSPKVIKRYNDLFRFLLNIKKTQYDLHYTWHVMRRDLNLNATVLELRNQFIFVIDNLQYYIQADVLESQFAILMNVVQNSTDFEEIQRAHSVFQGNILSLCFLLGNDVTDECGSSTTLSVDNPVLRILNDIFFQCEEFCALVKIPECSSFTNIQDKFEQLNAQLPATVEQLINLLFNLKSASTSTPLSQLLLRLDYNHWFSSNGQNNINASE